MHKSNNKYKTQRQQFNILIFISFLIIILVSISLYSNTVKLQSTNTDLSLECNLTSTQLTIAQDAVSELEMDVDELEIVNIDLENDNLLLLDLCKTLNERIDFFIDNMDESFITNYPLIGNERRMMYRLVEAEVTAYGIEEKMNVAHVLINRVYSNQFPNTIEGVIFQERQFSCIADGRYDDAMISKSSVDAVDLAIRNKDLTYGSLYFMSEAASDSGNVSWFKSKLEFVMNDRSGHSFYK
jgi:hypothetical protein